MSKKLTRIMTKYLTGDHMRKRVDVSIAKNIKLWGQQGSYRDVIELSNKLSFSSICEVLLGYDGMDIYEDFKNFINIASRVQSMITVYCALSHLALCNSIRRRILACKDRRLFKEMREAGFSEEETINNVATLLLTGTETTSYSLSRCVYHLDTIAQQELRETPSRVINYVNNIIFEHPPTSFAPFGHVTLEPIHTGGMIIPKNTHCIGVISLMNKDVQSSFTSFSLGVRSCPAQAIANYEIETFLTLLLQKTYRWKVLNKSKNDPLYTMVKKMKPFEYAFSPVIEYLQRDLL